MSVPPGQDLPGPDDRPASPLQALAADTAARLQAQALRALVAAFEHLLRQQGWARERLRMHAGSTVRVGLQAGAGFGLPAILPTGLPPPEVRLRITSEGFFEAAAFDAEPRATLLLIASADALFTAAREGVDGLSRHLRVEGDVMLAATLGELARDLRWDAEEDLSRVLGDVAAHRVFGLLRAGVQGLRERASQPLASFSRQVASGEAPVVSRSRVEGLRGDFQALDDRLRRLEQRAARLAPHPPARPSASGPTG
jgi:ubiquinone biosynthesis protein UbiJ